MDRRRDAGKSKIQLANLRALSAMPPRTKSGQVTWAWPEIQASLSSGRSLREIWEALQRDGIQMSYNQFRVYVSRIRKRIAGKPELMVPRLVPASDIDRGAAEPSGASRSESGHPDSLTTHFRITGRSGSRYVCLDYLPSQRR